MTIDSEPRPGAFAPPPGARAFEPPAPPGPPPSATPPPGRRWLLVVAIVAVVAVVAVFAVVLLAGGGDDAAEPLVGRYEGTDEAGVVLVVSGEPPALSELAFELRCGAITRSERVTLSTPLPIENGSFSLALPPPGAVEVSGSFGDGGQTASGSLSGGDCTTDWTAAYVAGSASGGPAGAPFDNAIDWGDAEVRLTAGNFYIAADGLVFLAPNPDVDVFWWSDHEGGSLYVEWDEHGREMDLEIDFESIGDEWWASEIEFTDGTEDGDWLEFSTGYFRSPIGTTFRTDVFELVGENDATLHFDDLAIEADLVTETEGGDDEPAAVEPTDDTASEDTVAEEPAGTDEFDDDFDGALATGWWWNDEQPDRWSLSTTPGFLDIVAGDDPTANLLLREPPATDHFAILTQLDFEPTENFQFAGLVIVGADPADEVIRLGRAFCDDVVCAGDGLYFDLIEDGVLVGPNYATPVSDPVDVLLVLEVVDDTVMAFADVDGEFIELGSHPLTFTPTAVGLAATNSPVDIVASFDSFGQYGLDDDAG